MTTDNRTNEQIVAEAVDSIHLSDWDDAQRLCVKNVTAAVIAGLDTAGRLVAAQEAAPQAEGVPKSTYISPHLPGMIRNLWKSDPSENSVRTALKLAGDLIQELIDLKASPVLPSSTVGEGLTVRLAEMLYDDQTGTRGKFATSAFRDAWVKRVRAVVEAIGGERR